MKLSIRNCWKGTVKSVSHGNIVTEVVLEIAPGVEAVSVISRHSAEALQLGRRGKQPMPWSNPAKCPSASNEGKGMLHRGFFTALVLWAALAGRAFAGEAPVIAAASDLKFALEEVAAQFGRDTGENVTLGFGSSGNFFRQIQQGGPFEMFLSADEAYVLELAKQGLTDGDGRLYATGRLALFAPKGAPFTPDEAMADLRAALREGRVKRFAIANPEHAPYGRAAKQALISQAMWVAVQDALVLGENIAQAAQFATSGAADGGIVAYSLALSPPLKDKGSFALLPEAWHEPLRQRMVLLKNAGPVARKFYDYLQRKAARAVFERYGFVVP